MPRRKTPYFPDYGRTLPNAGPDWIWQRAMYLVESGRYATMQRDGPLVRRAVALYRAKRRGFGGRGDEKLYSSDPDLIAAEAFENGPMLAVLELKMRLLAGQENEAIAAVLRKPEGFVATFAIFFFDVRDRLEAKSWVYHKVIGIRPGQEVSDEQMALRDAYHHGSSRIDGWIDFLTHRFEEHDLTTPFGRQREAFALRVAAQRLDLYRETTESLSKVMDIIAETRAKMFHPVSVNDQIRKNTREMLGDVRFRVSAERERRVSRDDSGKKRTKNSNVRRRTEKLVA